jgi:hypothetical protein
MQLHPPAHDLPAHGLPGDSSFVAFEFACDLVGINFLSTLYILTFLLESDSSARQVRHGFFNVIGYQRLGSIRNFRCVFVHLFVRHKIRMLFVRHNFIKFVAVTMNGWVKEHAVAYKFDESAKTAKIAKNRKTCENSYLLTPLFMELRFRPKASPVSKVVAARSFPAN